jgi:proteasome beta subunit
MNHNYAFQNPTESPNLHLLEQQKMEMLKTGTTTIGMIFKDGVILATESQATAGFFVATKKAQKLFQINDFVGATIAGGVADCQYVVGQAQAISRLNTIQQEKQPSVEHMANLVRNILFNGRSYFYAFMIVGGYSHEDKKGKIYPIDFIGLMADSEEYVSLGSGSSFALGVMEGNYKPNMTEKEGIALVTQALTAARNRDAGSGYGLQIAVITKDGFKAVEGPLKK